MRATIYARYSSELQRETSVEDQVRVCRARAEREGWTVAGVHSDSAVSGTVPVDQRAGGRQLLAEVVLGDMQVLLLEGLDRLSRDQLEQEKVVRRLEAHGVRIVGVSDGYDSASSARKLLRGVRGLINEMFLDDLAAKVHRGHAGQIARGFSTGSACYGYRMVRVEGGSRHEIHEEEAHWVRFIFERFAAGEGPYRIAHRLNELGIPAPKGAVWGMSTIYGSPAKGSGILNHELYAGRLTWNKSRGTIDPETGRKRRVKRPRAEWVVVERPELRIVDDATWRAARERIDAGRDGDGHKPAKRPTSTPFSGLLRCPHCGSAMLSLNNLSYGCQRRREAGPVGCPGFYIKRAVVDRRLMGYVREQLLTPEAAQLYEQRFRAGLQDARQRLGDVEQLQQRVQELQAEVGRLVDGIATVGASPALASRLQRTESDLQAAQVRLQALRRPPDVPDVRALFAQQLLDLAAALATSPQSARQMMGRILGPVQLVIDAGEVYATVQETQVALLAAGGSSTTVATGRRCPSSAS